MMTHRMIQRSRCIILTGRTGPWLRYFPTLRLPFHYSSDPHDQLTQSSRASHGFNSPFYHPNSRLTVELTRLLTDMIVTVSYPQCISPLHGTATHNADVPMGKPRRFL